MEMNTRALVLLMLAAAAADGVAAAPDCPPPPCFIRPVRVVVPYAPGSQVDILARTLAPRLAESLGQQFVVDNRTGASGNLGAELAARATPDGGTFLLTNVTGLASSSSLFSKLGFDPVKDFEPVALLAGAPSVLVTNPSLPANTVKELIALARAKPGQISFASAGVGSASHLSAELFMLMTGTKMAHVPYKGTGPALVDVLSGQTQVTFGSVASLMPHIKTGRAKALGVTSAKRLATLQDIPTIAEAGLPGFESTIQYGLLAPAKTPAPIVRSLNAEARKAVESPEIRKRLLDGGFEINPGTPTELAAYLKNETTKWAKVVRQANIKIE